PSGTSPPSDRTSPLQVQGQRSLNSSLLCSIRLVHSSSPQISEPSSSSGLPLVSGHQPRAGFPQQSSRFFPSRVETGEVFLARVFLIRLFPSFVLHTSLAQLVSIRVFGPFF
ncbi:unnamed protein product, partial [Meganyctiphanes norvegica]